MSRTMNKDNFAVLMAGGVGSRFWPVSTAANPKQFRDLLGSGETLLQTTFKRLNKLVPAENIYILTNQRYDSLVREQLPSVHQEQIVLEPAMRNTAPAVLLAAFKIGKRNRNAVMVMAPSDHWIEDEAAFVNDISLAFEACRSKERIVTLGIKPSFPNTGFGYIKFEEGGGPLHQVHNFTEKPDFETARKFLKEGNYVWNAGIFIWNISYILNSFRRNLPDMNQLLSAGYPVYNTPEEPAFIQSEYSKAQDISIDYGILEKEENVYVIQASFDWNDLGTWGSVYNEMEKDSNANAVLNARLMAMEATGNMIGTSTNKVVVVDGLKDYIIIDEEEVLLLVPKAKEQEIKAIRTAVQMKFGNNLG